MSQKLATDGVMESRGGSHNGRIYSASKLTNVRVRRCAAFGCELSRGIGQGVNDANQFDVVEFGGQFGMKAAQVAGANDA
jgi:hypothetical protein